MSTAYPKPPIDGAFRQGHIKVPVKNLNSKDFQNVLVEAFEKKGALWAQRQLKYYQPPHTDWQLLIVTPVQEGRFNALVRATQKALQKVASSKSKK